MPQSTLKGRLRGLQCQLNGPDPTNASPENTQEGRRRPQVDRENVLSEIKPVLTLDSVYREHLQ